MKECEDGGMRSRKEKRWEGTAMRGKTNKIKNSTGTKKEGKRLSFDHLI